MFPEVSSIVAARNAFESSAKIMGQQLVSTKTLNHEGH